jgi:fatty acid desaturase
VNAAVIFPPHAAATLGRLVSAVPARLNALLAALVLAAHGMLLFALPLLLRHNPRWAWAGAAVAATTGTLWSLLHEAIHGLLARERHRNDLLGRALGVAFGAPFAALRTGHLLHHRYSRTARERTEVYDPACTTRLRAAPAYYLRLLGGMYLAECAAALAALLPARNLAALARRMQSRESVVGLLLAELAAPRALAQFRIDCAAIALVWGASFWLYGESAWLLAAVIALRAFLVSVADNAYHYGTALDAPRAAKNVHAPRWLQAALLNFTLHGVHHRQPGLPWTALPRAFAAAGLDYDEGYGACLARQLQGPIAADALFGR